MQQPLRGSMDIQKFELGHKDITEKIIGAAFEVHRVLGYGFPGLVV